MGEVAYKLQLLDTTRIHLVFHVSQLKKVMGAKKVERELPPELKAEGPTFWPVRILERRQVQQGEEVVQQILVE